MADDISYSHLVRKESFIAFTEGEREVECRRCKQSFLTTAWRTTKYCGACKKIRTQETMAKANNKLKKKRLAQKAAKAPKAA